MNTTSETFRRLHAGPNPLVLINVWDAASARIVERAGAAAIATTSAGIAWSLGHPDGERLPFDDLLAACRRICSAVRLPVTVDLERGYAADAAEARERVRALLAIGVAGINIEDGIDAATGALNPIEALAERIAEIRALDRSLFINARTDVYFLPRSASTFDDALQRARLCIDAGADGIFMPGLSDPATMRRAADALDRPLNVYAGYDGAPTVDELARHGARRISVGCGAL
jgi:2-methylisocitrate lyase-like PEP mutase family enzyme